MTPVKLNTVKVLHGNFKNRIGKLLGIDGEDGIVKMEIDLKIAILDMSLLAPYVGIP